MDELDQILGSTDAGGAGPSGLMGGTAQAAGTQAPPAPMPKGMDDLDRILNDGQATDPLLDELIPLSMSGNTPETAMNKSPLSAQDRMKLSLGNLKGNVDYLRKRFQDVKQIKGEDGQPSNDLAVLQDGTWYRVDPNNGEIADPWERTKEYLKDASEFGPEALGAGVGAGAAWLSGGSAAPAVPLIAGATSGVVRTNLGRVVGTYNATPAEQAWDIGFESLMNLAGVKIAAGVKPTAKWVADKLDDVHRAFKDVMPEAVNKGGKRVADAIADTPKSIMKKIFASYSVGEQNFDTFLENPERTKALMKAAYAQTGANTDEYHNVITQRQVGSVKEAVLETPKIMTQIYGAMRNKILASVPESFTSNLDNSLYATYGDAVDLGIGRVWSPRGAHYETGEWLEGKAAKEFLAKTKDLRGVKFSLIPQKDLAARMTNAEDIGSEAAYLAHSGAYSSLDSYYKKLGLFAGGKDRTGVAGAKALLDFKKVATDIAWELENADEVKALTGVRDIIARSRTSIDNAALNGLKQAGDNVADMFTKMNSSYNELNQEMKPVLNVVRQYRETKNDKVFESLLGKFTSRGGKNVSEKGAFEGARSVAEAHGLKDIANKIATAQTDVRVGEAAKAFNPIKPGMYKSDMLGLSQAGMAMYALASGNPAMLAALIGVQTLRSPTTARAAAATMMGLAKGQAALNKMTKRELDRFLSDPAAIQSFVGGVSAAPLSYMQADQQLQQMIQQQTGQGQ